ncbi:uncharacterized protein K02A2.6-like [Coccinella septempunctata]|uniref:uncharacterized protein K02A2.6-like n=1 Tax=Coccinella septempunctata TaxID=41139 RepID=UPI001D081730|nr:uncharacterized protein K02A2.6-like [Coccinella septempunctata]
MEKMKALARSAVYWPNIDSDIEEKCKKCVPCLINKANPPHTELTPWPLATKPWERVHVDYMGPIKGLHFLIIRDAYTKWMEVFPVSKITSSNTVRHLRESFARYGIPELVVSDNGTQLVSREMEEFLKRNGIKHMTSPPGHQKPNGQAESAVKISKNKLKTYLADRENVREDMFTLTSRFLYHYRNSVHSSTSETPAKLMFNREIRTRWSLLKDKAHCARDTADSEALESL